MLPQTLNLQILQASVTWKQYAELPTKLSRGNTTVINGNIYFGGGVTAVGSDLYTVYCYDPSQHKLTTPPQLPVQRFGVGQVNGGKQKRGGIRTNEVYTCDEQSQKWKQTIPPMPTARLSPGILSLQSALVVAGVATPSGDYTDTVKIFKPDTSQWYKTDPLPTGCFDVSLVAIGNTCYALGGFKFPSHLNQALYASIDDLLCNAVPANQTTHSGSNDTQSAWKILPNTPTYRPAAAVLAGNLLAIGGQERSKGGADKKKVYVYSPSTNSWVYISDLPAPRSCTIVAVLPSTEILVIGGYDGGLVNTHGVQGYHTSQAMNTIVLLLFLYNVRLDHDNCP